MAITLNSLGPDTGYVGGTYRLDRSLLLTQNGPPLDYRDADKFAALLGKDGFIPPSLPNTAGFTECKIFDTYSKYVEKNGSKAAKSALDNGDQVIVGLRVPRSTRVNQGHGTYDDKIALIWQDKPRVQMPKAGVRNQPPPLPNRFNGNAVIPPDTMKHGMDFKANTVPTAQYEAQATRIKWDTNPKTGKPLPRKEPVAIIDPNGKVIKLRKDEGEMSTRTAEKILAN